MNNDFVFKVLRRGWVVTVVGLVGCSQTPAPVVSGFSQLKQSIHNNYMANGSFTERVSGGNAVEKNYAYQTNAMPVIQEEKLAEIEPAAGRVSSVERAVFDAEQAVLGEKKVTKSTTVGNVTTHKSTLKALNGAEKQGVNVYTVQAGDNLYSVARAFKTSPAEIKNLNPDADVTQLKIGQKIKVPAAGVAASNKGVSQTAKPEFVTHKVEQGETVYRIAQKYGASVLDVMAANAFQTPQDLKSGTMVKVPLSQEGAPQNALASASGTTSATPVNNQELGQKPASEPMNDMAFTQGVSPSKETLAEADKLAKELRGKVVSQAARANGLAWPVDGQIIRKFGEQGNGVTHSGINIAVPENTAVVSAEKGTVIYAGDGLKTYGNLVLLRHADGMVTAYAHNNKLLVGKGDKVKKGQVIALSGRTGNVDQPQLHFEIRRAAKAIDPMQSLAAK